MIKTKKGDFVEIEFTAEIKGTGQIFDLTDEEDAKKNKLHNKDFSYGPRAICIGQKYVIKGLDDFLVDKEIGKDYTIDIKPEDGFGLKNPKLTKIVATNLFLKDDIRPIPGLQVNAGSLLATVKSVSGGRTILDFNHPLAGKDVIYKVKIKKLIDSEIKKVQTVLENLLNLKENAYQLKEEEKEIKLTLNFPVPDKLKEEISKKIKEVIPTINLFISGKNVPEK